MFKFIHAADVHLDSRLIGLDRYEGAPVDDVRGASRRALENLVELAISREVAFVLLAGDLYDGDWKDYNTGLFFAAQMSRLRKAGVRVFIVAGNHDAASRITKHLKMPDNVMVFSTRKSETALLTEFETAIHGRGFAKKAVTENLAASYPARVDGYFNVGLLHTNVDSREGHEPYAPCSLHDLLAKDYDYWALGHVHRRETLHENPWIVYPGNIQGRHAREPGPRGCALVTVDGTEVESVERVNLDVVRWFILDVDAGGAQTADDALERVATGIQNLIEENDGVSLALRVRISGACKAHGSLVTQKDRWTNEVRQIANDAGDDRAWVEKVEIKTRGEADLEKLLERDDSMGDLLRTIRDLGISTDDLSALFAENNDLKKLATQIPVELKRGAEPLDLADEETMIQYLEDARQLLLAYLPGSEVAQ